MKLLRRQPLVKTDGLMYRHIRIYYPTPSLRGNMGWSPLRRVQGVWGSGRAASYANIFAPVVSNTETPSLPHPWRNSSEQSISPTPDNPEHWKEGVRGSREWVSSTYVKSLHVGRGMHQLGLTGWKSDPQMWVGIRITSLVCENTYKKQPQTFWFIRSRVRLENLHLP